MKKFTKNDEEFICVNCRRKVAPLSYTSRDHCPYCLCSLHVDINPGDRKNSCGGVMYPIDLEFNQNKGYVIVYRCSKCNESHKNKASNDDDKNVLIKIANKTYR